jgi:enamine deaminase RidA (YjgF/YER057c/UK114 family)
MFAQRFASVLSALGLTAAVSPMGSFAQSSPPQDANGIRKLNAEGKPGSEKDVIMPVIVYNGLMYVSGVGAHDTRDAKEWTIESHTTMVMDKVKKMVEVGGGSMDSVLQANVFLVKIEHWDGMHKVFSTYFPHGGPSRTTVAVAALPGDSLVEINCIAAVTRKGKCQGACAWESTRSGIDAGFSVRRPPSRRPSSRLVGFSQRPVSRRREATRLAASGRPAIPTTNLACPPSSTARGR